MVDSLKLKSLRVLHNLSSTDMSRILKMNKNSYSMKENSRRKFTAEEIEDMYYYFQMNPEQLVDIFFTRKVHSKGTARSKNKLT